MDISKFIKERNNPYDDGLDNKLDKVDELLEQKVISSKLASALVEFIIRNQINDVVKTNLGHALHQHDKKDKWFLINYSKTSTNYI